MAITRLNPEYQAPLSTSLHNCTSSNSYVTGVSYRRYGNVIFLSGSIGAGAKDWVDSTINAPTAPSTVPITIGRVAGGSDAVNINAYYNVYKQVRFYIPKALTYGMIWSCTFIV